MKKRPDFNHLIMLDLSPSQAVLLLGAIGALLEKTDLSDVPELEEVLGFVAGRIRLQLKQLAWPTDRGLTPYPV